MHSDRGDPIVLDQTAATAPICTVYQQLARVVHDEVAALQRQPLKAPVFAFDDATRLVSIQVPCVVFE